MAGLQYDSGFTYDSALLYDGYHLPCSPVSFVLTGVSNSLKLNRKVSCSTASFTLTGIAARVNPTSVSVSVPLTHFDLTGGGNFYVVQYVEFNGDPIPAEHLADAQSLEGDAKVDLFQIILPDNLTKIFLKQNSDVQWQGDTYEGTSIKIEGVGNYSDETVSRPKLTVFNPAGVFSYLLDGGLLDNAIIVRYRVLKQHIVADLPVYIRQQWKVSRIASIKSSFIALELRDMLDGQNFLTPGRMFIPPDFPTVSLG